MALTNVITAGASPQAPPIVAELQALFERLDDAPLIAAIVNPIRRGPKGHPVRVLWQCFVAKYALGLSSTEALRRELRNNPFIAQACGIDSPDGIPHHSTFSRFFARLARRKVLPKLKDVSRSLVREHYATLPGFGQRVALDSTTIKGWVNGGKPNPSDSQAGWSVKKNSHGKTEFTLGYKLHLLVDTEYELPIAAHVSAGNVHDARCASNVLGQARFATGGKFHPQYVMADKGYSGKPLIHLIRRQYRAQPIIDIPQGHKTLLREFRQQMKTPEWKALAKQRSAVERVFSRLKGQRSLGHITVRRKMKVRVHCYLSLIALQATAVAPRCD